MKLQVKEWRYLCEGNANIVLTFEGDAEEFKGCVMRIRKSPYEKNPQYELHNLHMESVFEGCVEKSRVLPVTKEFLSDLEKEIFTLRPDRRKNHHIEILHLFVEIQRNLTSPYVLPFSCPEELEDVFTIEIKPKWGVINIHDIHRCKFFHLKRKKCRFCIHQITKVDSGEFGNVTKYCPIEIYSSKSRVRALQNLFDVPQHFLQVFRNGVKMENDFFEDDRNSKLLIPILEKILNHSRILEKLQLVQMTNLYDIELIKLIYDDLVEKNLFDELKESLLGEDISWMENEPTLMGNITEEFKSLEFRCGEENDIIHRKEDVIQMCKEDVNYSRKILKKFAMSKSARDCSILITLSDVSEKSGEFKKEFKKNEGMVEDRGKKYAFHYSIIDLDHKLVKKIPYWYDMDLKLCENYLTKTSHK